MTAYASHGRHAGVRVFCISENVKCFMWGLEITFASARVRAAHLGAAGAHAEAVVFTGAVQFQQDASPLFGARVGEGKNRAGGSP